MTLQKTLRKSVWPLIAGTAVFFVLAACGQSKEAGPPDARITVVATTSFLGDVADNIVGTDADVEVLIPIGADPHDYQASAQQIAALQRADLVISVGLGLEGALADVLSEANASGIEVFEIGPLVDPIPFVFSQSNDQGIQDPHVWLDPVRMANATTLLANALTTIDSSIDWKGRAETFAEELLAADDEIKSILDQVPIPDRQLVTNHDALGYFADRYGFKVIGTVIPGGSTLAEPSSAELANLVKVIEKSGTSAIFVETTESSVLAESVAKEIGREVEVVVLHTGSLGEPGSDEATLIGMLRSNALLIAEALLGG